MNVSDFYKDGDHYVLLLDSGNFSIYVDMTSEELENFRKEVNSEPHDLNDTSHLKVMQVVAE